MRQLLLGDAGAGVAHRDQHRAVLALRWRCGLGLVGHDLRGLLLQTLDLQLHGGVQLRLVGFELPILLRLDQVDALLQDFIEQRLKSDPIARKILAMDATATRRLDTQALEQILIGHMMAICGEANQIFRPVTMADYGVDGEVEFRDNDGKASGKKIYIQLKSGDSYLRLRKADEKEIFDVQNERHLEYWVSQPVDVYLVIRQTDEVSGGSSIRWMNLTRYLKARKDKQSRQIIFVSKMIDISVKRLEESARIAQI